MVKGRIYRVSGPLVVAEGMSGSMMYEVVEVGNERLIGEIIGIHGDKAYIQVYEDTTGLTIGEPVVSTGELLSAELGPGLISSIFDGIQRPLPAIEALVGPFVRRGVKLPALRRDVKWHFKPREGLKEGGDVSGGAIIGEVKESPLITHKIMVPPNAHGRLLWLAKEGNYTIEEPIATIEHEGRKVDIKLYQKWPVRKPRPYKAKLNPEEPLITGIRVIDFLFPLAKGGKAAIPGGFGTGKCVVPGTPVLLADGTVKTIDEIFKEVKGGEPDPNVDEECFELKEPILLYGFNGKQFILVRATHVYKGKTDRIVRIKTASGRVIEVTPIHKLPIYNPDGYIEEREARDIAPGTYLVIPRKISIPAETPRIPIEELGKYDDVVSRDSEVNEKVRKVLRQMLSRGLVDKIVKETGLSKLTIRGIIYSKQYSVPLKLIVAINRLSKDEVIGYPTILGLRRSKYSIRVPHYINCDIAELLGLIVSNGMVTHRTIRFFSNNDMIRKRFNVLLEKAFGIRGKERVFNAVKSIEVNSALLARLFKLLGIPDKRKSRKVRVPLIIMRSPEEIIAAFIRGLYLGDGTFSKNTVEYMSGSKELITDLSYLLTRLGILYSVKFGKGKNRLYISRIPELTKFYRVILREAPCIKNIENLKRYIGSRRQEQLSREAIPISSKLLREVYRALSKRKLGARGINVGNYVYGYENPSRSGLLKLATTVGSISYQEQMKIERLLTVVSNLVNLLEHIALDKVEEVEVLRRHTTVYDLTVEDTHNFIGGLIPVIYHNTVTLQELTKWSYANVTIYIGCGERGNEMADALHSFLKLQDPRSGRPLIERAIFIANTSNMPVAAREASIYMGITIAEYFRDMGYDVLLVADSTSRWAEAMREISGRLEEMPGEEGFPAYLGSRIAEFYERTGRVIALGDPERVGSVTVVGAVSPPGADFSEPVTQNTLRYIRTLLALDVALANRRHFPAINWLISYSLYVDEVADWWAKNVHPKWKEYRTKTMELLQREAELSEVVRLVGPDALPEPDKLVLEVAKMIREDFLFQSAYHPIDKHSPPERTMMMIEAILKFYEYAKKAVEHGYPVSEIRSLPIRYKIARMRDIPKEEFKKRMEELMKEIETTFIKLLSG